MIPSQLFLDQSGELVNWEGQQAKKKKLLLCNNHSFAEGMFTGGTFAGRMVKPFKAFKRQQHTAATGLLVYIKVNCFLDVLGSEDNYPQR